MVRSCHEGLASPPTGGNAMVSIYTGFTSASPYVVFPHAAGEAIMAVEGTIRVLPGIASGMPLAPFDTAGWDSSVPEDVRSADDEARPTG